LPVKTANRPNQPNHIQQPITPVLAPKDYSCCIDATLPIPATISVTRAVTSHPKTYNYAFITAIAWCTCFTFNGGDRKTSAQLNNKKTPTSVSGWFNPLLHMSGSTLSLSRGCSTAPTTSCVYKPSRPRPHPILNSPVAQYPAHEDLLYPRGAPCSRQTDIVCDYAHLLRVEPTYRATLNNSLPPPLQRMLLPVFEPTIPDRHPTTQQLRAREVAIPPGRVQHRVVSPRAQRGPGTGKASNRFWVLVFMRHVRGDLSDVGACCHFLRCCTAAFIQRTKTYNVRPYSTRSFVPLPAASVRYYQLVALNPWLTYA
jgi:hypothetical protein